MPTKLFAEEADLEMVRRIAACLNTKRPVSVALTAHRPDELRIALADVRHTQKRYTHVGRGKLVVQRGEVTRTLAVEGSLWTKRKVTDAVRADLVAGAAARFVAGFLTAPSRSKVVAVEKPAADDRFAQRFVSLLRKHGYAPKLVEDVNDHERTWGRLRIGAARVDLDRRAARLTETRSAFGDRWFATKLRTTLPAGATEDAGHAKLAGLLLAWFENAAGVL